MPSPSRRSAGALNLRRASVRRAFAAALSAVAAATLAQPPHGAGAVPAPGAVHAGTPAGGARGAVEPRALLAAPPDGTYTYGIARNGTEQGKTVVAYLRRARPDRLEADEAIVVDALRAHVVATFRGADLGAASYVATYQAPFERSSPLGAVAAARGRGFYDQTTVRFTDDGTRAAYTVDGDPSERAIPDPSPVPGAPKAAVRPFLADAPLLAAALLAPAERHASGTAVLAPFALALGDGHADPVVGRVVRAAPRAPKTPRTDTALEYPGFATYWFDPHTFVVHEVFFEAENLDAHLIAYEKVAQPAPFIPTPTPAPAPPLPSSDVQIDGTGNVTLAGVRVDPPGAKQPYPAIVLVAPPEPSPPSRSFGGDGPEPMFPALARAFAAKGYAVLSYDQRGAGKTAGAPAATWDESLDDVESAVSSLLEGDGIDKARVYVLGYGYGADLALAAAADPASKLAGVIALAPSVLPYRTVLERQVAASSGQASQRPTAAGTPDGAAPPAAAPPEAVAHALHALDPWMKSALGHDPVTLAARVRVPVFVLHSGVEHPGHTKDDVRAYDDRLHAANARATILVASDLSDRFGGLYDADAAADTEAMFPYRFDASTEAAIADWLAAPKPPAAPAAPGVAAPTPLSPSLRSQPTPPPPPPLAH